MRRALRSLVLVAALGAAAGAGCAPAARPAGSSYNRNLITRADLDRVQARTLRQAVEQLRPNWLTRQGTQTLGGVERVQVYIDMSRMGGLEVLDNLQSVDFESLRFLDAAEATNRFGQGHTAGVIVLTRRSGG